MYDSVLKNDKRGYVSTGHYARRMVHDGYQLVEASDESKDQSYFIYQIMRDILSHTCFPIGSLKKDEVRSVTRNTLPFLYGKPDSQGICFIGNVRLGDFMKRYITPHIGNVIDSAGAVIGAHNGHEFYTIGQRHGFHVTKNSSREWYVIAKNPRENVLIVGDRMQAHRTEFRITTQKSYWRQDPDTHQAYTVRVRNLGEKIVCELQKENNYLVCRLHKPEFGVSPGQHAVFYDKHVVMGGGIIEYETPYNF